MEIFKIIFWDVVDYLESCEDMVVYFEVVFEEGDFVLIFVVLGDIVCFKGMILIVKEIGLGWESFYKVLFVNGNFEFVMVLKVMEVLGLCF